MPDRHERFAEVYNDIAAYPTIAHVAAKLGLAVKSVKNTASVLRRRFREGQPGIPELISRQGTAAGAYASSAHRELEVADLPDPDEPIEELIDRAIRHNEKLAKFHLAKNIIDVTVNVEGPIAVAGLPDPHLNNVGTNLREALRVADIISTPPHPKEP